MKKKRVKKKSIFSRLVKSYVLFLIVTIVLYLTLTLAIVMYLGNGSLSNASPQTVVKYDGTITDTEVLEHSGGWVEELDESGNVVDVVGEKKTDKYTYNIEELAYLVDMGYVASSGNGVIISQHEATDKKIYSACARYVGDPKRVFLVFYPTDMVTYRVTYMLTNETGNRYLVFLLVFAALFVVEIVGISLYLKRHIEMPLKFLMQGMDEVSEGKRDVVIDYITDKEFEDIRDRFNSMAEKLKESEDKRHQVEQSRNLMLLELAHDIKNPIASIKGSICALEEGLVPEEKVNDYYKTIEMKAERIRTLTEDINTSLKMESDEYKLNLEKADVCELVRRICAEFYEDITAAGKEFDIDISEESLFAEVDTQLLGRAINNLLGNANKYNETGNNIAVKVFDDSGRITIEVSDDGEAIAEDFAARMFESFARGDKTRKTDGGTGLGLAISRKIVEKHGGTLKYKRSDGKNCFTIVL
ncbi:HAMP domain-containing sensor histidine kinase [Butyrivibrio sp. INlla16]|uniref:HAMP domain-containing sensor histidine kinase n=1 Tax=Butyrivibrio sp. INlla16 TaxID=1520807 RepID=UPI00087F3A94|nr:HAMP domain-containing sensor histidine kinase [Butyrivibrio sp. INlla16]SDB11267.1 Signal transduction histidine kinase [Butyrivibrio sp. INlla16]